MLGRKTDDTTDAGDTIEGCLNLSFGHTFLDKNFETHEFCKNKNKKTTLNMFFTYKIIDVGTIDDGEYFEFNKPLEKFHCRATSDLRLEYYRFATVNNWTFVFFNGELK